MKKSLWCLLLGYTFLFYLAGCDTDDGRAIDPETVFQLYPPEYGAIGYTENYNITGTIELNTEETEVSGTYVSLIGNIGLPDATVDTFSESVSLEVTSQNGAATININGIIWYDSSTDEPVYMHETISGTVLPPQTITATPLDISILPPTAKVGDFGTGTSWIYNDGRTSDSNWFLQASRRGGAWLTSESTVNDGDTLLREYIHSVKINERGERESIYLELVDYVSNFTMTISGDRTN
ncbi:MAG: hypothetical protein AMK70_01245 [Nitrospira bacterium SG8_35_1]|nr:MAG: hypothetical protein AMK70_01245 [Nitrospira bacterium SG8_35_1]